MKDISKNGFQHVFEDWQKCWDKYFAIMRVCFEKDRQNYEDDKFTSVMLSLYR